jgi:hypothetical protein
MDSQIVGFLEILMGQAGWVGAVLAWLGVLVVLGQGVVVVTPTKKDDAVMAKIFGIPFVGPLIRAIASFAPIQKK